MPANVSRIVFLNNKGTKQQSFSAKQKAGKSILRADFQLRYFVSLLFVCILSG
jgi:hypothetical protein